MATCTNKKTALYQPIRVNLSPHLPGVFSKLSVALLVKLGRVVDPPVDPVRVPLTALAVLAEGLAAGGQTVQGLAELLGLMPHIPANIKVETFIR